MLKRVLYETYVVVICGCIMVALAGCIAWELTKDAWRRGLAWRARPAGMTARELTGAPAAAPPPTRLDGISTAASGGIAEAGEHPAPYIDSGDAAMVLPGPPRAVT